MKRTVTVWIALVGLAVGTGVVVWLGAGHILTAIIRIGWLGLVYVLSGQLAVFLMLGIAWWVFCPGVRVGVVIWARLVRGGGQTCLPFSQIGGLVVGARALMLSGVDFTRAAASSIVDVIAEGIGLAPFLLFGSIVLLIRNSTSSVTRPLGMGLGALLLGGLLVLVLRRRLARLLRLGAAKLLEPWVENAPQRAEELQRMLEALLRDKGRVAIGSIVHLLCWCGGGGNVWVAYHLLGAQLSLVDALAIESILNGVLVIGLLVPAALGVQELAYVGIGRLFGIPAYLSLSLSLIRRARDLLLGAPALLLWQGLEARRLRKD